MTRQLPVRSQAFAFVQQAVHDAIAELEDREWVLDSLGVGQFGDNHKGKLGRKRSKTNGIKLGDMASGLWVSWVSPSAARQVPGPVPIVPVTKILVIALKWIKFQFFESDSPFCWIIYFSKGEYFDERVSRDKCQPDCGD